MICNPALKNVLTYLCSLRICNPQQRSMLFLLLGDCKSPGFNRSNLFLRRIANPPGRLAGFMLLGMPRCVWGVCGIHVV